MIAQRSTELKTGMKEPSWSVSGLRVTARPEELAAVCALLTARPGIEIHAVDPDRGQLVVTQELATIQEHQEELRAIQALPGVLAAELVAHFQESAVPDPPDHTGGA